jgi:hypothetical protein
MNGRKTYTYKQRFTFLAVLRTDRRIRFQVYAPDAMQLKWNVFDCEQKVTVGLGHNAIEAVDEAIHRTNFYVPTIKKKSSPVS